MRLTLKQLAQWSLPATPINYAVAYEYVSEKNVPLITRLDQQLFNHSGHLDNFIIEELYQQFVLGQSAFRDTLVDDIEHVVDNVKNQCLTTTVKSRQFSEHLAQGLTVIDSADKARVKTVMAQLKAKADALTKQQQVLVETMLASQAKTKQYQQELAEFRKEIYLDPITGLYNKKALAKHFEAWVSEDPNKQIAAVVVNVDHFIDFSEKFGSLIGDVILSKIANKISNYVGESGLPVRTGNDEFLILLPEVEQTVVAEIAEKMRQSIEKIRFISSKSGVRLPQMTVSLGISELQLKEPLSTLIKRTKEALTKAQHAGRNRIAIV